MWLRSRPASPTHGGLLTGTRVVWGRLVTDKQSPMLVLHPHAHPDRGGYSLKNEQFGTWPRDAAVLPVRIMLHLCLVMRLHTLPVASERPGKKDINWQAPGNSHRPTIQGPDSLKHEMLCEY